MFSLIILSLGLAMDAVAVALVRGATGEHRVFRAIEIGAAFGIAQGIMPLLGWAVGAAFSNAIAAYDHWIAFVLLCGLGARMLLEAASSSEEDRPSRHRSHYTGLFIASIATSVDAAVAGVTLPLLNQPVFKACLVIGAVTAALCIPAYWLGTRASRRMGKAAEFVGGIVLIGLGTKILIEHLTA